MTTKEDIKRRLADIGWEVRVADAGAVVGGSGKCRVMVSFDRLGEPTSVIIAHVGRGGGILSGKWRGLRNLPSPERAARTLWK
ncbi:MAG: hypothetical protein M3494_11230, partial [Actinomycetota bacterium]|jgi:hypothetical protein|nr:hypothetical protein [Actinomycetota bacterium]